MHVSVVRLRFCYDPVSKSKEIQTKCWRSLLPAFYLGVHLQTQSISLTCNFAVCHSNHGFIHLKSWFKAAFAPAWVYYKQSWSRHPIEACTYPLASVSLVFTPSLSPKVVVSSVELLAFVTEDNFLVFCLATNAVSFHSKCSVIS